MTCTVRKLTVSAYEVPTDGPEADGTLSWASTAVVVVEAEAGDRRGLGYGYAHLAAASLAAAELAPRVCGGDAMATTAAHLAMWRECRNLGRRGVAAHALSAVDAALWDLKARLLGIPLLQLLGPCRGRIPVYGSGGFTSYDERRLCEQLAGWVEQGIAMVKMKVGSDPAADPARVRAARRAIGDEAELFVDANGAYDRKQALALARRFADEGGVSWFEEPVSSDDVEGLRLLRDLAPAGMEITAGEYGYDLFDFRRLLEGGAVDVLQPDATRCGGVTGFLRAGALCSAHALPLSAHTAPSLHAHPCCALPGARHVEYFHDHARIERLLFDGALTPEGGALAPAADRPGLGLELKRQDAARYQTFRKEITS